MVDYSKWKNIEVSDDEDETHPNIDTPSLFRWRHQARVERMQEADREKKELEEKKKKNEIKLKEVKENFKSTSDEEVKKKLEELEKEAADIRLEEEQMKKKDKQTPWNVDTISKPGFQKTVINKEAFRSTDSMTEEEREKYTQEFITKYKKELKEYGMYSKYIDSKKYLLKHHHLVCEETANYLVIWCIQLEMEEKHDLMARVAHQCICMQYILDISKQLKVDPRACVDSFFDRIEIAEVDYRKQFESEIESFKDRIRKRAAEKIRDAQAEEEAQETLEREKRLGPGGLDPVEVFESLPKVLQDCFESRNIGLLQETIAKMNEEEARYHMKRCVDSGLWVPDAGKETTLTSEDDTEENSENKGEKSE
uniref:Hsp90 co-chaperone Cdc37 n=1 Tax=Corethrella appendiculata TaxID=1370023 RepID=U5EY37_9DIPT